MNLASTRTGVYVHAYMLYACVFARVHVHTHTHTYMHIYIQTYILMYTSHLSRAPLHLVTFMAQKPLQFSDSVAGAGHSI